MLKFVNQAKWEIGHADSGQGKSDICVFCEKIGVRTVLSSVLRD